jgi:hypothetical protein
MTDPIDTYWQLRLERCRQALKKNNFEVFMAADTQSAGAIFLNDILPGIEVKTAAWGDSMTMLATGVLDAVRSDPGIQLIDPFDPQASPEERLERRRQALLTDLFFTGSNAVTETGLLVNLDMVGNRVAGITFGPRPWCCSSAAIKLSRPSTTPCNASRTTPPRPMPSGTPGLKTPAPKPPCAPTAAARTASATPGASPKNASPRAGSKSS